MKTAARVACVGCLLALALPAWAQAPASKPAPTPATATTPAASAARAARVSGPIRSELQVRRVLTDAAGVETLEETRAVNVGDVVQYTGVYTNVSDRRLLNVAFAIAVPRGMSYLPDSAQPADGQLLEPSEGRPRRMLWRIARMEPGGSVELRLRVRVDPDPTLTPMPAGPRRPELRRSQPAQP